MQPSDTPQNENDLPPKEVDVLGKKFTIELLSPDENTDCDGYMDFASLKIGLRLQPAMGYNQDTVVHEITHAIDEVLSLGLRERQVHQLAAGFIAVLKQNPALVEWLLK
jgi:hypothetical protein